MPDSARVHVSWVSVVLQGENMDSANTFAVVTMLATIVTLPVAIALEYKKVVPAWQAAIATPGMTEAKLATTLFMSGYDPARHASVFSCVVCARACVEHPPPSS